MCDRENNGSPEINSVLGCEILKTRTIPIFTFCNSIQPGICFVYSEYLCQLLNKMDEDKSISQRKKGGRILTRIFISD